MRLTEAFVRADPPKPAEVRALERYLEYMLSDMHWIEAGRDDVMIGVGGTIRALAKIDQRLRDYPLDRVHGYVLTLRAVEDIIDALQRLPLHKRKKIAGLDDDTRSPDCSPGRTTP